jgi:hypothetical protein
MAPHYVTFEQAIALKEKGFNIICNQGYNQVTKGLIEMPNKNDENILISAPEQWMVVEWLEQFGIYIDTRCLNSTKGNNFEVCIHRMNDVIKLKNGFDTRKAAYSAAFDYILKELI